VNSSFIEKTFNKIVNTFSQNEYQVNRKREMTTDFRVILSLCINIVQSAT